RKAPVWEGVGVVDVGGGGRGPLAGQVIEGTGTAIGRDGLPLPVLPDSIIPPGARLYGGPFTVRLWGKETFQAFIPQSRPTLIGSSLYRRYLQAVSPLSFLYAATTAVFTRSFDRTLIALLLVNPRVAAIGLDNADIAAAARVIRAGVTVVGTRKNRHIRLPGFVLLDGARVLTNGLEFGCALSLSKEYDAA